MTTSDELAAQIRLLRMGHGPEKNEAIRLLSRACDSETVSRLANALREAWAGWLLYSTSPRYIGSYVIGSADGRQELRQTVNLPDAAWEDINEAESIATVLANIGTPAAFDALAAAWKDGLHTIEPQIRKFGARGDEFLHPRSLLDRIFGRRWWVDRKQSGIR